jgi:hypothetical protein
MKPSCEAIIVLSFVLAVSANTLVAQPYSFDENGNGTQLIAFEPFLLPFEVAPDPSGGITSSPVLIYFLGAPVVSGDVALMEPGQSTVSKLLRFFTPAGGGNSDAIFYSQVDGTLAGVGIPYTDNPVQISEVDPQTLWYPKNNQPGATTWGALPMWTSFRYNIITKGPPPPIYVSGTNMIWHFTNGFSNAQFFVIASTNISLPPTNWTCVITNQFNQNGCCQLTLPMEPDKPYRYYRIAMPPP